MTHDFRSTINSIKISVNRYLAKVETRRNEYANLEREIRNFQAKLPAVRAKLMLRNDTGVATRQSVKLLSELIRIHSRKQELLNEMDTLMAKTASLVVYVIDLELSGQYKDSLLSSWARTTVYDMVSKKIILEDEEETISIQFPAAVGILAPYIFKTGQESTYRFAGVRNAIRRFIEV